MFQAIICLRSSISIEGIGFYDISTSFQIAVMDGLNEIGTRYVEQIIISLYIDRMIRELYSTEIFFTQPLILNHGTHSTIKDDNSFL